ncbi:SAM-dependent methyltransferase [Actinoplanes sp. NPDC048988]|uniref:SAM-dependent methyltransferase n=1 Tax=Actinoplanes sp. NPDC048988 TaxID=3363901 RepID=UPI00371FD902
MIGEADAQAVPEVDMQRPSVSRMYNYFLGGRHNFAADREAAAAALTAMPELPAIVRLNRRFLRRAVTRAHEAGVGQFLDLGCGIPSPGDAREVVRELDPHAPVVGVDVEASAYLHGCCVTEDDPHAGMVLADLTDPGLVLGSPVVRDLIDLDRPVGLLLVAVAHFIPDTERLARALDDYRRALAPGSVLALTHGSRKGSSERTERVRRIYNNTTAPMVMRDQADVRAFFGDWALLSPGVTLVGEWMAEEDLDEVAQRAFIVGMSRKIGT